MSDFTIKFDLLKKIEEVANKRIKPITFLIEDSRSYFHQDGDRFSCLNIETKHLDYEFYFDNLDRDKFHDLYVGHEESIRLPYFRNMVFEDETMFILQDEYNIVKFIKLLEINDLEKFLSELKEV